MDDDFLFADEDGADAAPPSVSASRAAAGPEAGGAEPGWKILVVDDEPEVHAMTAMVMADITYRGRGVVMLSAYSAAEAQQVLAAHQDIACILLDVVMESEDAGLRLVRHIREEIVNTRVRIILRTGQPGQAPERDVIINYDINDYKAKTELTAQKLFTAVISSLRSYEDIMALEMNRQGLQRIIDASASLFQVRSMRSFASGVLTQLSTLLGTDVSGILCVQWARAGSPHAVGEEDGLFVLAGSGEFEGGEEADRTLTVPDREHLMEELHRVLEAKASSYRQDVVALYIRTPNNREAVAYLKTGRQLTPMDEQLLEVFCAKVSAGFDNLWLYDQLRRAHEATVLALADLAEYKDTDTGDHVLRVEDMTNRTARQLRAQGRCCDVIDDLFLEQIGLASILHDVGKVSTPDSILQKPGKLTEEEWAVMKDHATAGGALLERAASLVEGSSYLSLGAEIASGHHERWDGKGYPRGLKGEEIPLSARIVAVVDVYDALVSRRPYKDPWPPGQALAYIRNGSGLQFDPQVVQAFLAVMEQQGYHPTDDDA
ncbi:DUF3369 domain-containing protein [Novispirillum itersonii]|uniref:DUF3369 domain-containing protein n=1 Tax=Novispirillum itersonii TaxID=189 RepID=UPI0003647AF1|nr:DUF3369 domain-containing protein [Novispirillum itersonii]